MHFFDALVSCCTTGKSSFNTSKSVLYFKSCFPYEFIKFLLPSLCKALHKIGRKNYLFCGSHKAAQNAAMLYSFFGSCKMKNINPREWLEDTLQRIPDHSIQKLEELLPGYQENITA